MGGNYQKDMFRQLTETLEKIDNLQNEFSDFKTVSKKEIETLKTENQELRKENTALKTENQKLKDIINKNSGNSSKPPSSDGFVKIQNSREKTGRKPGGQSGHKGHKPKLFENPNEIIEIKKAKCPCGGHVKYDGKYTAKQLADVEIRADIKEYREHIGTCECCNKKVKNHAPVNDIITYGDTLKALCSMLTVEGCVSINRTQQMLSEMTGGIINLSEGTIAKWTCDLALRVVPAIAQTKEKLLVSPVLHKDETGVRVGDKLHWFHVLGSKTHTLYTSHKKRGKEADKEMGVLSAYSGVLVHDHLVGLYDFTCDHAECNAHILRYLKAAVQSKERKWAQDMIKLLLEAKDGDGKSDIPGKYDEIIKAGQKEFLKDEEPDYNGDDMKLLRRMKKYKTEHLRFVTDENVPFDNNQAERDLRMLKAKTKISGCFRADNGGEVFANIKSYTSTLRKNGLNIFDGIRNAFKFQPVFC